MALKLKLSRPPASSRPHGRPVTQFAQLPEPSGPATFLIAPPGARPRAARGSTGRRTRSGRRRSGVARRRLPLAGGRPAPADAWPGSGGAEGGNGRPRCQASAPPGPGRPGLPALTPAPRGGRQRGPGRRPPPRSSVSRVAPEAGAERGLAEADGRADRRTDGRTRGGGPVPRTPRRPEGERV